MQQLARLLIDEELAPLRKINILNLRSGSWIRLVRESLGMTTAQLAKRAGVSQPRIVAIEKAEANDAVTLRTLRQTAEALDCELVYALLPTSTLEKRLKARAEQLADEQLRRTHHTMKLEAQALTKAALKRERERLIEDFLKGDLRRLWDDA
ncbi:MAG TPA: mobile mystery protein A [Caulobacteraceae bacterium]|jgi:predicted DNA-binding mobile mystery protein A|nr:mobile mystery protein A [Caulobacteraceae bacterium]